MNNSFTQETRGQFAVFFAKLLHFAISLIVFFASWLLFRYGQVFGIVDRAYRYNAFVLIGYAVMLLFFFRTFNAYLLGYYRIRQLVLMQFVSQFLSILIVYLAVSLAWAQWKSPLWFIPMLVLQGIIDLAWIFMACALFFYHNPQRKTLFIYRNRIDKKRFGAIAGKPTERLYQITDELQYDGSFQDLKPQLAGYDAIFVAGINSHCRNGILKYCKENSVPGFFLPHVGDVLMQGAIHIQSFSSPVFFVTRTQIRPEYRMIKRLFDIISSLMGIIVLSPIMLMTALIIKLTDKGPVLYKQVRLTMGGKTFKILKFRSMRVDAEKDGVARLSTGENDDRITPVGRFIRKFRIDELPQLFNILKGDMSVVGPRPERPEIAEQYYQIIPEFKLRLQVKAGLTGYAQVYGRYNTDPYEKLEFDLLYINKMSLLTDLQMIFATLITMMKKDSTEGVSGVTAVDYEEEN